MQQRSLRAALFFLHSNSQQNPANTRVKNNQIQLFLTNTQFNLNPLEKRQSQSAQQHTKNTIINKLTHSLMIHHFQGQIANT